MRTLPPPSGRSSALTSHDALANIDTPDATSSSLSVASHTVATPSKTSSTVSPGAAGSASNDTTNVAAAASESAPPSA